MVKILKNNGVTPYHVCYEVDSIEKSIFELRMLHFMPTSKINFAPAISEYGKVVFLYHNDFGLIELFER